MKNVRIIPRLDIKGPNLVKGIHLEGLRVLGKPWDFARRYYEDGADELIYIDTVASLYGRNNLAEIIKKTADNIFIPLTVGGGIRTLEDIKYILRLGADKVAINTAAVARPNLISEAANTFGSQCIVISIQAKLINNQYVVMTDNGREKSKKLVLDWIKESVDLGAGEILLTSIDKDGTGTGYDISLLTQAAKICTVPLIVCGGCGKTLHFAEAIFSGKADAICAASIFHYNRLKLEVNIDEYLGEGNIEFIKNNSGSSNLPLKNISSSSIPEIKKILIEMGINCRIIKNSCLI